MKVLKIERNTTTVRVVARLTSKEAANHLRFVPKAMAPAVAAGFVKSGGTCRVRCMQGRKSAHHYLELLA